MRLAIDIGNTAVKWAVFEGSELRHSSTIAILDPTSRAFEEELKQYPIEQALLCASGDTSALTSQLSAFQFPLSTLNATTPLPLRLDYKTPQTLGADRIADACGAWALHRGEACLVIDAGTCITVDFVDAAGVYHGGAIMPGLGMELRALNTMTDKLPLVSLDGVDHAPVLGRSTEESILAGTLGATMLALAGFVALYREKAPALHVILTGGDANRLAAAGASGWELQPHLTLFGLNEIMIHNEK